MATQREKNTAKNKRSLVDALLNRIKIEKFSAIKISDLCKDAAVSQASFYNYFPQKVDMVIYFIQLWTLETSWYALIDSKTGEGLGVIESIFVRMADSIRDHPEIIGEVIAFQATNKMPDHWPSINDAEKQLAFPNLNGIETIEAKGLDGIILPNLQAAVQRGELPENTPLMSLMIALTSLFFGVPILRDNFPPEALEGIISEQLQLIWAGARSISKES